jgi:hypothetical protein
VGEGRKSDYPVAGRYSRESDSLVGGGILGTRVPVGWAEGGGRDQIPWWGGTQQGIRFLVGGTKQ